MLVKEAILGGQISEFRNVDRIESEVKTSQHSRLDLRLVQGKSEIYMEVKNCSLSIDGCAMFPDAVTVRGSKHLQELTRLVAEGAGAVIFFLVQRADADRFAPAEHIDPAYSKALRLAVSKGVRVLVYQAVVSPDGIQVIKPLPFVG